MKFSRLTVVMAAGLLLVTGVLSTVAAPVASSAPTHPRTETLVQTSSPIKSVVESVVRVKIPLPPSTGAHPAACDWLSYLRYRDADGPTTSTLADKILIAQPGVLEGAGAFDSVARNTVAAAALNDVHIEFWALDRRSNCLEDHTGVNAALASKNIDKAVDYYYRGAIADGHTFSGFRPNSELGWLADVGIERTVVDQYDLMTAELPDQSFRSRKVLCGGHSLGGALTADFVQWDFDGQPGYKQCAGYFALDTAVNTTLPLGSVPTLTAMLPKTPFGVDALDRLLHSGLIPRSADLPALINPETMNLLAIVGAATRLKPNSETSLLKEIRNSNIDNSLRVLFSPNPLAFATGSSPLRNVRLTNAALLGGLMDNNSEPLAFLQTAVGIFDGGPLADKDFPLSHDANTAAKQITAGLLGPDVLAVPTVANGPLYGWQNFNNLTGRSQLDRHGNPYTTPAKEVTDIDELARSLAEQPLDFTEQYFPMKLVIDSVLGATTPEITNHLRHPEGLTARPVINLLGGSGITVDATNPPINTPRERTVIASGYHHLDVLTAAARQNNGLTDPISTSLAEFASQ